MIPNDLTATLRRGWSRSLRTIAQFARREDPRRIGMFDRSALFLAIVTSIWFSVAYLLNASFSPGNPDAKPVFLTWHDQAQYMKMARDLGDGQLVPEEYWLGYPALAVPFLALLPHNPFFIPDLVLVLFMMGAFYACCRHGMGRLEAWLLMGVFIFFEPIMRDGSLINPWNTLPAYCAIYVSAYLLVFKRPRLTSFLVCALLAGGAVLARPTELLPLAALFGVAALAWPDRRKWWAFGFIAVTVGAALAFTLTLNLILYGKTSSPYMTSEGTKFSHAYMGWKVYQLLCDGAFLIGDSAGPQGSRTTQLLERFPYFLFLVPGAIYLVKKYGWRAAGLLLAIVASVGFYLTYNLVDNPAYFWTYGSYHYFWWIVPWLAFLTWMSFRQAWFVLPRRTWWCALLAPVLLYAVIGFKAHTVAATDGTGAPLNVATSYHDQTFTITLTAPADEGTIEDVRVSFVHAPPYFGSTVAAAQKMTASINGVRQRNPQQFVVSQDGSRDYDFSFLAHGLPLRRGDTITLTFADTPPPELRRASLLDIRFAPGQAVARFLTR